MYGAVLFLCVLQAIGIFVPCSAQGNALTQYEQVSLFSWAVLDTLQVLFSI